MKFKKLVVLMGILSSIFGYGQNKNTTSASIYPKENFSVVDLTFSDGKPAVGSFDMGYKKYTHKNNYPWCLKIGIALNLENCMKNGLPEMEESSLAYRLEDELLNKIKGITTMHYIGHLLNNSFLDIFIYLDDPKEVHEWLQTQINKEGLIRGFGYEINKDSKWRIVKNFMNLGN